jgi:hypothetical protein
MSTEKPRKHRLTPDERRRGQAAGAATKRDRREEERVLLSEMRRSALDAAVQKLAELAERATATIALLLDGESEAVRARVAFGVLEVLDAAELRELSDRIARLEEIANTNGRST